MESFDMQSNGAEDGQTARHFESGPPNSGALILHSTDADSAGFIEIATHVISSVAATNNWPHIYSVHVDNWFGPRWLGFRGKLLGAAGVRNRTLKRRLIVPPFHPNRVLNAVGYHRNESGAYEAAEDLSSLHTQRTSESNIDNTIRKNILYTWYSGNTVATNKGVLMVYYETRSGTTAFYVMFNGDLDWRLDQHIGITRAEANDLVVAHA